MADIDSLFDCFEEPTKNEASAQFPNLKSDGNIS